MGISRGPQKIVGIARGTPKIGSAAAPSLGMGMADRLKMSLTCYHMKIGSLYVKSCGH